MKKQLKSLRKKFRRRILNDPQYRRWVLLQLYGQQTPDEQDEARTIHDNEVGFNYIDDKILSCLAETSIGGHTLTVKDEEQLCRRLPKYWLQFVVPTLAEPSQVETKKTASQVGIKKEAA